MIGHIKKRPQSFVYNANIKLQQNWLKRSSILNMNSLVQFNPNYPRLLNLLSYFIRKKPKFISKLSRNNFRLFRYFGKYSRFLIVSMKQLFLPNYIMMVDFWKDLNKKLYKHSFHVNGLLRFNYRIEVLKSKVFNKSPSTIKFRSNKYKFKIPLTRNPDMLSLLKTMKKKSLFKFKRFGTMSHYKRFFKLFLNKHRNIRIFKRVQSSWTLNNVFSI